MSDYFSRLPLAHLLWFAGALIAHGSPSIGLPVLLTGFVVLVVPNPFERRDQ